MLVWDGLFVMTNGQTYVCLDQFSDTWCKFWRYVFMAGEGFVTLIALNAERIFVLNLPFVARRFVTATRLRIELFCLLLVILIVSLVNLDLYKITTANAVNKVPNLTTWTFQHFSFVVQIRRKGKTRWIQTHAASVLYEYTCRQGRSYHRAWGYCPSSFYQSILPN